MFTGIVEEIGHIGNILRNPSSVRLMIRCKKVLEDAKIGDSIAVNGICLTVSDRKDDAFWADVMPETMRMTALGSLQLSDPVNLERALKASDRLGGHIVSGHIDGTGILESRRTEDNAVWLTIHAQRSIMRYMVQKGSVALDGTSLTIADISGDRLKVSLIPHTAGATILGAKREGSAVNIECDLIAKYVEKLTDNQNDAAGIEKGISMDFLRDNGFV